MSTGSVVFSFRAGASKYSHDCRPKIAHRPVAQCSKNSQQWEVSPRACPQQPRHNPEIPNAALRPGWTRSSQSATATSPAREGMGLYMVQFETGSPTLCMELLLGPGYF